MTMVCQSPNFGRRLRADVQLPIIIPILEGPLITSGHPATILGFYSKIGQKSLLHMTNPDLSKYYKTHSSFFLSLLDPFVIVPEAKNLLKKKRKAPGHLFYTF